MILNIDKKCFSNPKFFFNAILVGLSDICRGMIRGAMNMVNIAIAIATAGIIVGAVGSTGLSNAMIEVVEFISGGNNIILLLMVTVSYTHLTLPTNREV